MRSVAELAAEPYKSGTKDSQSHLIEHNVGNVTLKRLVQNDASRIKEGETGKAVMSIDISACIFCVEKYL